MHKKRTPRALPALIAVLAAIFCTLVVGVLADGGDAAEATSIFYGTAWSLLPPVIAIVLALITKEVYSSLFVGILAGGLLYSNFSFEGTVLHIFNGGIVSVLSDGYNVGILIFLVILGAMVSLMNRAGGSAAFGRWAAKRIKTRVGAQLATTALGVLIFVDDYFNCLTVGSVMRPVTDKHNVSRAKLAYLIDATAAPVCIIAPISSWAAAVAGFASESDANGIALFISAIPYNFYALLTILMMITLSVTKTDFGPMAIHERNALKGDLFTTENRPYADADAHEDTSKGKVIDLVLPVVVLVVACVIGLIYTGGFFSGESFVSAFANCSASMGLVLGSSVALVFAIIFFIIRRVLSFKDCMACIPEGFKAMVPAILILTFAWTLKSMTDSLGAAEFVAGVVKASAGSFMNFLPAVIFLIACLLSFATGTSWGTFGILIPIVLAVFGTDSGALSTISMSACMAGAVCGDHCSPISDTTIMSSAGAQCDHVNHVSTQLPYAISVAGISFITYLICGVLITVGMANPVWVALPLGIVLTIVYIMLMKRATSKKYASQA